MSHPGTQQGGDKGAVPHPHTEADCNNVTFFLYETSEVAFIVQTQRVRRGGIETHSLIAFWPREDYAHDFHSEGAAGDRAGDRPEGRVRECFENSQVIASLFESGALRSLHE
jgi:hypothetical protein